MTCTGVCYLYSVRVRGLTQNLQQGGVGHKEKTRKHQPFLLQVTGQRLLTELQLLQEVRQQLEEERGGERKLSLRHRHTVL